MPRSSRLRFVVGVFVIVVFLVALPSTLSEDPLIEETEAEQVQSEGANVDPPSPDQPRSREHSSDAKENPTQFEPFHELDESDEGIRPLTPYEITDSNWETLDEGEWFLEFFAPWCPACRSLQPRWDELARDLHSLESTRVRVAKCDVTQNPWLTGRMMIATLPTIFHIKDKEYRKYGGRRSVQDLFDFVVSEKWKTTPVLEKWREPHGAAMKAMSGFYKVANMVQSMHDLMTVTYGFPAWASYVIFGLSTLACGLSMGLIIVCCMDCLSTPTTPERRAAIVEKNRRAREQKARQAKLLEEIEARKKEKEQRTDDPAVDDVEGQEGEEDDDDVIEVSESQAEEDDAVRRRRGYRPLEEGQSTEEEDDYDDTDDDGETEEEEDDDTEPEEISETVEDKKRK